MKNPLFLLSWQERGSEILEMVRLMLNTDAISQDIFDRKPDTAGMIFLC